MSEPEIIPPSAPAEAERPGPDPASPPPSRAEQPTRADGGRWLGAGLGLALVLAAAALAGVTYLVWFAPPPLVNTAAIDQKLQASEADIAALRSRLDAAERRAAAAKDLETRLAAIEQRAGNASASSGETAQQLRALGDRIAALEQQLASKPDSSTALADLQTETKSLEAETQSLAQKLEALSQTLSALAAHQQPTDRGEAALLIALQQLRLALAGSEPYAGPLHTAEALAKDRADLLQQLQGFDARATSGIPTMAQLVASFESTASRVLDAMPAPSDSGWFAGAGNFLMRFFDVRRESGGSDAESVLAAAQKALKRGDLAAAIAALKRLGGPGAEAARGWLADAAARADAEQRMSAIDAAVEHEWVTSAPQEPKP